MTIRIRPRREIDWELASKVGILLVTPLLVQLTFPRLQFTSSRYGTFFDNNKSILINLFFLALGIASCIRTNWKIKTTIQSAQVTLVIFIGAIFFAYSKMSTFRDAFAITKMKMPFADWLAVFDFLHCRRGFGNISCDRFGRPWIYGDGFRIFSFISSERFFVILGLASYFLCVFGAVQVLKQYLSIPQLLILGASPSFLFESDRLNVDLFCFALIFLSHKQFKTMNKIRDYLIFGSRVILNAFKPLFLIHSIIRKDSVLKIASFGILSLSVIFLAFHTFGNLQIARAASYYDQHSQFGSQFFAQFFVTSSNPTLLAFLGFILVTISTIAYKKIFINDIIQLSTASDSLKSNFGMISSSAVLYLVLYFSGSQVIYASLAGVLLAAFLVSHQLSFSKETRALIVFGFCGSLQIGFSIIRVMESFFLAIFCLTFLIVNFNRHKQNESVKS